MLILDNNKEPEPEQTQLESVRLVEEQVIDETIEIHPEVSGKTFCRVSIMFTEKQWHSLKKIWVNTAPKRTIQELILLSAELSGEIIKDLREKKSE